MGSLPIQIVDENDQPVGAAPKQEAWEKGLIHRVVRVMVENSKGQVLLQHRSPAKDIYPNCWDPSASGHVDAGESYEDAVQHEVAEELGFTDLKPVEVGRYRTDHTWENHQFRRFVRCYKASHEGMPEHFEAGKIDGFKWFTIQEAKELIKNYPDQVSDGLEEFFERYY